MKIFLSTHGSMASGMLSSVRLLAGNVDCITAFDAYVNPEERLEEHIDAFLEGYPSEEKLLVSDMLGGSVNHSMMQYIDRPNTHIITGISLPLLLELVVRAGDDLTVEELDTIINSARTMTKRVTKVLDPVPDQDLFS